MKFLIPFTYPLFAAILTTGFLSPQLPQHRHRHQHAVRPADTIRTQPHHQQIGGVILGMSSLDDDEEEDKTDSEKGENNDEEVAKSTTGSAAMDWQMEQKQIQTDIEEEK
jgi:hypothetical protein